MSRPLVDIIVVCEDQTQYSFICHFLKKYYKWNNSHLKRVLRHSDFPKDGSGGSGEKHVRDTYPVEMRNLQPYSVLIAVMDADKHTVASHHAELAAAAESAGLGSRSLESPVVHIIPKWSIETWLCYLEKLGPVDETKSMKNQFRRDKQVMQTCAKQLVNCYRATEKDKQGTCPESAPESLKSAKPELDRFLKVYSAAKRR